MWQVTAVIGKDRVKICSDNPSPIILSSALASQSFEEREIVLGRGRGHFWTLYLLTGHSLDLSSLRTGTCVFSVWVYPTLRAWDLIQGRFVGLKVTPSRWKSTFPHQETSHLLLGEALQLNTNHFWDFLNSPEVFLYFSVSGLYAK